VPTYYAAVRLTFDLLSKLAYPLLLPWRMFTPISVFLCLFVLESWDRWSDTQ